MKRFHLFEIEDQSWCPKWLRDYGTDYLQYIVNRFDAMKGILPIIQKGVEKSGGKQILDMASGGGGAWLSLSKHLLEADPELKIQLSDYYPNIEAFKRTVKLGGPAFSYRAEPLDAMDVPKDLKGLRTQFLSLHHFRPDDAKKILQNAVDSQQPIAIFELTERRWKNLLSFPLIPFIVFFVTPWIRPFRWGRLFFTYIIPLVQILIVWDGFVSVLRTYTVEEMKEMANSLDGAENYVWEAGRQKSGPGNVLYLLGYPKK